MFWVAWRAFNSISAVWSKFLSLPWVSQVWNFALMVPWSKFVLKQTIRLTPAYLGLAISEWEWFEINLDPGEWSKEEIISVLMFIASYKLAWSSYRNASNHTAGQNFKFSKNNGNVQVQMWPPKPTKLQAQYPNMNNVQPLSKAKILAKKAKKAWNKIKDTLTFNN